MLVNGHLPSHLPHSESTVQNSSRTNNGRGASVEFVTACVGLPEDGSIVINTDGANVVRATDDIDVIGLSVGLLLLLLLPPPTVDPAGATVSTTSSTVRNSNCDSSEVITATIPAAVEQSDSAQSTVTEEA